MHVSMDRITPNHGCVFVNNLNVDAQKSSLFSRIIRRLFGEKRIVQLGNDVHTQCSAELGLRHVTKYRFNKRSVYVKHVFIEHIGGIVKPKLTSSDINFFRALDKVSMRCYVLVYVKNAYTHNYDHAVLLDDFEAIQGIKSAEAARRLVDLSQASQVIRNILL
ncbi:hypothetical protein PA25_35750 [Pseudoalteromonas sp. A25]|uniref:hypothetical protein n=1 Tax=Pseudoalteromonas sp. A25 TaxID=116092 RepID=UPI001260BEFC|nr:hypothetical protein [Pseudoalteromonas sp. A25]BBN83590.1 hypothetical protein PA25_35750 [Pseudoalteromonas sp. A25]